MELTVRHTREDSRTFLFGKQKSSRFTITHWVTFTSEEREILREYHLGTYLVSLAGLPEGAAEPSLARLFTILKDGVKEYTTNPIETVTYMRFVQETCGMLRSVISLFESAEQTVSTAFP